jgi:hypothetical protein
MEKQDSGFVNQETKPSTALYKVHEVQRDNVTTRLSTFAV